MSDQDTKRSSPSQDDTLGLTASEMRRLGRLVVDLVVDHLCNRGAEAAVQTGNPDDLMRSLGGPLPEQPSNPDEALDLLVSKCLSNQQHGDHPRYFSRVPGPSSFAAILGDWLGIGFNTIATSWVGGSGPATLEVVVLAWIRELLGLPPSGEGILVSGGSIANLVAFAAASASVGRGVVYLSDQAHASLPRALRLLGYAGHDIRTIESDEQFRLPLDVLVREIERDRLNGGRPTILVATAGTTNTGAVDSIDDMADLAARYDMWLHVDGAYGASAAAVLHARPLLNGIGRADSMVIDPHKWMFQPYGLGCVLVRTEGTLEKVFSMAPEYLRDTVSAAGEPSFGNRGPELTRRSRALKLWMTFRTYGADRMRAAIARGIQLAEYAEQAIRRAPCALEIVTPAQLAIVTFALRGADYARHEQAASALVDSGLASISTTTLKGKSALRLCILNPLTREKDIDDTIQFLVRDHGLGADEDT